MRTSGNKAGVVLNKASIVFNKAGVVVNKASVVFNKASDVFNKAGVVVKKVGVVFNKAGVGVVVNKSNLLDGANLRPFLRYKNLIWCSQFPPGPGKYTPREEASVGISSSARPTTSSHQSTTPLGHQSTLFGRPPRPRSAANLLPLSATNLPCSATTLPCSAS